MRQLAGLDLHGGFLITSTAAGAASLIRRLLEADDVVVVEEEESEVNQTPMERNRDLKDEDEDDDDDDELLPLLVVPRSESGRDHAGLHAQRRPCSGVSRPDDEGDRDPRRSRPAMLRQTRRGLIELGRCRCQLPAILFARAPDRVHGRPAKPSGGGGARVAARPGKHR